MKLSPRLKAIASLIKEPILYDVGCDHALLDIYMSENYNTTCIAIDISEKALTGAKKNIEKYNLNYKIKTVANDGLEDIPIHSDSCVVIAGMGTKNILKIIKDKDIKHLIIQSNNDLPILRKEIIKNGYKIDNELIIKEGHIYNCIISFIKGNQKYNHLDYEFGPIVRKNKDTINQKYLEYLLDVRSTIAKQLPTNHIIKKSINAYFIYKLKKELNKFI